MFRVLIVDDALTTRTLVRRILALEGHEVLEADEALTAWPLMITQHPDVVILDIMMPAVSGLELCQAMRADPQLAHMPILVLTARGLPGDEAMALRAGADGFLSKPFSPGALLAAVAALAGGSQLRKSHEP